MESLEDDSGKSVPGGRPESERRTPFEDAQLRMAAGLGGLKTMEADPPSCPPDNCDKCHCA